jgi:hypothetical protein
MRNILRNAAWISDFPLSKKKNPIINIINIVITTTSLENDNKPQYLNTAQHVTGMVPKYLK